MTAHHPRTGPNKTDAGNGSKAICRVSNVLRSPSPDPRRSPNLEVLRHMNSLLRVLAAWMCVVALSACLKFGDNIELTGSSITQKEIDQIVQLTGVKLPPGTVGLNYIYFGDGIDPALAAKLSIPLTSRDAFLMNEVFGKGDIQQPSLGFATGQKWWAPQTLSDRVDRTMNLPSGRFVEITCGVEGGSFVIYLDWMST